MRSRYAMRRSFRRALFRALEQPQPPMSRRAGCLSFIVVMSVFLTCAVTCEREKATVAEERRAADEEFFRVKNAAEKAAWDRYRRAPERTLSPSSIRESPPASDRAGTTGSLLPE